MSNEELIRKIMESGQMSNDKLYQKAMEGAAFIATAIDTTREDEVVASTSSEFCDQCYAFSLLPDPNPYDWFRDGDKKAVCSEVKGVIEGSLEIPSEWTNIRKPLYCPKLGRKLTEEEKEEAATRLKWAQKRWVEEVMK